MSTHSVRTTSAGETEALAADLAAGLKSGDVVLISGELGAGKTTFVRGAARALGVEEPVVSPTFTIGRRYQGQGVTVSHLDLYRLAGLEEEDPGILDDYVSAEAIAFVEWPAAAGAALSDPAARVTMEHGGGDERLVVIERAR